MIDTKGLGFEQVVACYAVLGRKTAVVDTGYASSGEVVVSALKNLGVEKLDYIIPTHVHLDHSGGAWVLAEKFPEATVLAHEKAVKHIIDPTKLLASVLEVYGADILNYFGEVRPIPAERVCKVSDGETLSLGDVELTFLYTPGHAPHQFSVMVSDGSLLTADAVPVKYPGKNFIIPSTPPPSFDLEQYLSSLWKLGELESSVFLTPHFGPTSSGHEWVSHLVQKTVEFVESAEKAFKQGGSVANIYKALETKIRAESSTPLPVYAENLIKLSAMGLHEYFKRKNP